MSDNINSETPIFDELNAQSKTFPDLLKPEPLVKDEAVKSLAATALEAPSPKKELPSLEGWSASSRAVLEPILAAIELGSRTVNGESFTNFANNHIRNGHVVSYEIPRLRETVRSL